MFDGQPYSVTAEVIELKSVIDVMKAELQVIPELHKVIDRMKKKVE